MLEAGDKGLIKQRWKKKDACISDAMGDDRGRGRERTNPPPPLLQTINNQFYNSQCATPFIRNITASPTVNLPRELVQKEGNR